MPSGRFWPGPRPRKLGFSAPLVCYAATRNPTSELQTHDQRIQKFPISKFLRRDTNGEHDFMDPKSLENKLALHLSAFELEAIASIRGHINLKRQSGCFHMAIRDTSIQPPNLM